MKMQRAHYHLGRGDRQLTATFYPVQNGLLITGQNARSLVDRAGTLAGTLRFTKTS